MIRSGVLVNENGVPEIEENFEEAAKSINASVVPTRIPSEVQEIFNDPACVNLTSEVMIFMECQSHYTLSEQ